MATASTIGRAMEDEVIRIEVSVLENRKADSRSFNHRMPAPDACSSRAVSRRPRRKARKLNGGDYLP